MRMLDIHVTDRHGRKHPAKQAVCQCGMSASWVIFQIEGQNHTHYMCSICGSSYCPEGACVAAGNSGLGETIKGR